ncbi:hypothetical protein H0H92_005280 [Tricholoma furcatifolium]|nr:hypothetical protein H0H92_005280 [Tricholoma furcatifolium]
MSTPEDLDCDVAAQLLARLCPDSIRGHTKVDIGSPQSFAYLLFRSNKLFSLVKEAMLTGNFEEVWKTCLSVAQPDESATLRNLRRGHQVPGLLKMMSKNLQKLVNGEIQLPFWSLERSTLPGVVTLNHSLGEGYPPMLFHNLGGFEQDPILKERVQNVFKRNQNTFLVNASATGKTRLLLEGLCKNWGFYITAQPDVLEAGTLHETLLAGIRREHELISPLPSASALSFDRTLARNREIAKRRFSLVLISHLLVFKEFLSTAFGSLSDDHKHRWLVAQLWHKCLYYPRDMFQSILFALEWETSADIDKLLAEVLTDIGSLLPDPMKSDGLFFVIDEANSAIAPLWRLHPDDMGSYPALKEMIEVWKEKLAPLNIPITFVVAGTEIPFHYFPSSSQEWSSWRWTSDTGAFDTSGAQRQYLASVLPVSFLETPSGQALVRRAWDWCGSRHRLTASLVQMLLEDDLVHPHGVFNRYIKELTMHETREADVFVALEGLYKRFSSSFSQLGNVIEVIGPGSLHFDRSKIELVTTGVGEFIDKDMKIIALDQRMLIIGIASHLSRYDREEHKQCSLTSFEDFCTYFQDRWPDGDTYVARNYIAFALAHVFAEGRALNEVFTIPAPSTWIGESSESANLVVLRKDATGIVRELVLDSLALHPSSPPLGFVASTAEDVISWLNHERSAAFCFCPPECGAELIFVLKIKQKNFWVVVRTAGRGTQNPDIDLCEEFRRLKLKNLFPDLTSSNRLSDAFNTLPNSACADGTMSVLRVLASFPSEPELLRNVTQWLEASPAATLNNVTFKSVTESIEGSTIIEALISSMQGKRGAYTDAMFNVINKTKIELGSPQSFAYLLFRSNKLCIQVKEAMDTANFEEVWKTCLLVAQPEELESQGYVRSGLTVPHLLDGISQGLEALVSGKAKLPLWSLEHSTVPGVVTMDLDSFLLNSSATGKTRLLFEGLCQNWGLYFTARSELRDAAWKSSTFIHEKLEEVFKEIRILFPPSIKEHGLFVVLDEANSALTELWQSHSVDTESYPVLKEIINVWKEQLAPLDIPITFVVAGTEIPSRYFPPSSKEWSSWRWTSDTGAFDTPEAQRQYLASILPASFLETPSGQALVRRAWDWCGSRHRFTASLVHVLLKNKLVHPHGIFNRYIKELTMYEARDADDLVALEGLYEGSTNREKSGNILERYPCANFTTHGAIFHYTITGQGSLRFDISKIELVTTGVGEFVNKDMNNIALDQRIPIIGVALHLSRYDRTAHKQYSLTSFEDFCTYFQDRWPDGDTYVARNYIAFALAHVFAEGRALNEVFTIPNFPEWIGESSESANLVVLRKDATGIVHELVLDSSALHPSSPPLGFVASTADDVIAWLNHERSAAFCCCPPECGAELIFILKIKQKNFWVVVRTAGRGTQTPEIDLYEELERLKLKNLFPDPVSAVRFFHSLIKTFQLLFCKTLATSLPDAFNNLPNCASAHGNMSVLRVLASFPSEPQLLRNVAQRLKQPPAATLNNATFKSVTESIEGSTIIEALISSMQGKRGEYSDVMFNVIASQSRKPCSKAASGEAVVHTPIRRRNPREHRVSESSWANRSPPALEAKAPSPASPTPPSPSLAKRPSPASPSTPLSPLKRSSSASPKPHTKFRKGNTEKDLLSAEDPPILRCSPRQYKVSDSSSER